jgi:broad specificity phosphatase PhoE
MVQVLFWLVRHGTTTDSGKNIFRGQRNSALDKEGFRDAHDAKMFFRKHEWKYIFCSPLTRAIQTATIISDDRKDSDPLVIQGFVPWDIGYLTGKDKKKYAKEMQFFIDHPDQVPDHGESEHQFESRVFPLFAEAMHVGLEVGTPSIVVAHSSLVHAVSHMLYGPKHQELAVDPGGAVEVYIEDGEIKARAAFKKGTDDSSYSVKDKHQHQVS